MSGATREVLVRLAGDAARDGRLQEYLDALDAIDRRLRTDPVTFGEETYDLRALRLTIKTGAVLPLSVEFAVYPDRPLVFVRTFRYVTRG